MLLNIILAIVILVLTLVLIRKNVNLGLIMLICSAAVAAIMRIPPDKAALYMLNGMISERTINILALIIMIMILENIMRNSGMIKLLSDSLAHLVGDKRYVIMLLPVIIGLLPSPGGARFSCPMVEETLGDSVPNEKKAFINFWFRHITMYSFILSSSAILASYMLGISAMGLFFRMLPFMLLVTLIGFIYVMKHVPASVNDTNIKAPGTFKYHMKVFLTNMMPILVVIVLYVAMLPYTAYGLQIALAVVIISLLVIKKYTWEKIVKAAKESLHLKLLFIVCGVMIFNEVLMRSGIMIHFNDFVMGHGIPVKLIYVIFPVIIGMLSGMTIAVVSLTFPILLSLGMADNLFLGILAYASGHFGLMITPMHICGMLTADYFKVKINVMLRETAIYLLPLLGVILVLLYFA